MPESALDVSARAATPSTASRAGLRSLPNLLGIGRIVVTPVIVALVLLAFPGAALIAFALFAAASVSDIVDGRIARARHAVTPLGVFMDLTADKVLAAGVMIAMVEVELLPTWVVATIIVRDFVVQGIRQVAAESHLVMSARGLGKGKTLATYSGVGLLLLAYDAATHGPLARLDAAIPAAFAMAGFWLAVGATVLSVVSGLLYVRTALPILLAPDRS